jgi:hypothetical protein
MLQTPRLTRRSWLASLLAVASVGFLTPRAARTYGLVTVDNAFSRHGLNRSLVRVTLDGRDVTRSVLEAHDRQGLDRLPARAPRRH